MPVAKVFIDTNVWVYAHLRGADDARHAVALARVEGEAGAIISPQVVAEYYSVMLRNGRADVWIQSNLRAIFARTRLQPANAVVLNATLALRNRYGFSFWDCQIAAAALVAGCTILLTEDLQHGQLLDERLRVVNPFSGG